MQLKIFDGHNRAIGTWTLDVMCEDGFGTPRAQPSGFVSIDGIAGEANSVQFELKFPASWEAVRNVFVQTAPLDFGRRAAVINALANSFEFVVDEQWPILSGDVRKSGDTVRLFKRDDRNRHVEYLAALRESMISYDAADAIARLQTRLEQLAEACAISTNFGQKYGVSRIMTVGSTSRQTYANAYCDFDLVICTNVRQAEIPRVEIRQLVDTLVRQIQATAEFEEYLNALRLSRQREPTSILVESFFGVRGVESFVARFELKAEGYIFNALDITFGRIPQLIGYEIWIQRYFRRLGDKAADQLKKEIRITKNLLSAMGGLYGTGIGGFRGNVIEQLVIQSRNYRCVTESPGSMDNALLLITEEIGSDIEELSFKEYKLRFPLWHPGWWEKEVGFTDAQPGVNILNLLGNGDDVLGECQWRRVKALAIAYFRNAELEWTIESVVMAAQQLLRESNQSTACRPPLGWQRG